LLQPVADRGLLNRTVREGPRSSAIGVRIEGTQAYPSALCPSLEKKLDLDLKYSIYGAFWALFPVQ